jgi:Flp pilus assembly protein TadG
MEVDMSRFAGACERQRGQVLPIVAGAIVGLILILGFVLDFGYYFVQGRAAQNTSDMAAMAGTRIVAEHLVGDPNGTDANVKTAIDKVIAANSDAAVTYGAAGSPLYVDFSGQIATDPTCNPAGYVGAGCTPSSAHGVVVKITRQWSPFFIELAGIRTVSLTQSATARAAFQASNFPGTLPTSFQTTVPPGSFVIPYAISLKTFQTSTPCDKAITNPAACPGGIIEFNKDGSWNMPGGFGWLKFCPTPPGQDPTPCDNYTGPDPNSKPFLQTELGHPGGAATPGADNLGCCGTITPPATVEVDSIPGNKASADLSWYINNNVVVWVPIFNGVGSGHGANGSYFIVGYAGMQITDSKGAKDTFGVLRVPNIQVSAGGGTPGSGSSGSTPGSGYSTATTAINIQLLH